MYSQSIVFSHSAYLRSLASIQAMDMAERIEANIFLDNDSEDYVIGDQDSDGVTSNGCNALTTTLNCVASNCTTAEIREWDQVRWCTKTASLFGGIFQGAAITLDGDDYIIGIQWSERDINSVSGSNISTAYFNYRMRRPDYD